MQGDFQAFEAENFEPIDEKRSKCKLCNKVIFKLLIKAHSNHHMNTVEIPLPLNIERKPVVNAVKKTCLQINGPMQSEIINKTVEAERNGNDDKRNKERSEVICEDNNLRIREDKNLRFVSSLVGNNFENRLIEVQLPMKRPSQILNCLREANKIKMHLYKVNRTFQRSMMLQCLRGFKKFRKYKKTP